MMDKLYLYSIIFYLIIIFNLKINAVPIVSGEPVSSDNEYKFAVSFLKERTNFDNISDYIHFCGGTYLKNGWILTASHCVDQMNISDVIAAIGERDVKNFNGAFYKLLGIVSKPFNVDDIALVRIEIKGAADLNITDHISIHDTNEIINTNDCIIFGYGATEFTGDPSLTLRYGNVKIITKEECDKILGIYMAPEPGSGMFCANSDNIEAPIDACQGDSGGSLLCKSSNGYKIVGIISHGSGCGVPNMPGVYTQVQHHASWIQETIRNN